MNCRCGRKAVAQGFCKQHYIQEKEKEFLDNTDPLDLGILRWARYHLPEYLPQRSPKLHIEILLTILKLFDPFYINKNERLRNIISFRGSSKSTLINKLFNLYILCHNGQRMRILGVDGRPKEVLIQENLIVIASETGPVAEEFVVDIRNQLTGNDSLKYFYGGKVQDAMDALEGQWTKRAFKFNKCFLLGVGSGMQIRGRIRGYSRPSLIFFDDIYSENNVKTEDGRRGVRIWFERSAMNSVDDLTGKAVCLGTILHEDSVLIDNKNSDEWITHEYSVMPLDKFERFVRQHILFDNKTGRCRLPFDDEPIEEKRLMMQRGYFQKVQDSEDWELAWPERLSLYYLAGKYRQAMQKRELGALYQEYFHVIVSDDQKVIKKEYIIHDDFEIITLYGRCWYKGTLFDGRLVPINIELGLDFGTGTIDGDDSVVVVAGILPNRMRVVIDLSVGKFGARDVKDISSMRMYGRVEQDFGNIQKKGLMDEAIRQALRYKYVNKIKVGYAGTEKDRLDVIRQLAQINGIYAPVIGRKQDRMEGKKAERILSRLVPYYESRSVIHRRGLDDLEYQLEFLKKSKHDDLADGLEVAFWEMQPPDDIDIGSYTIQPQIRRLGEKKTLKSNQFDWRSMN